MRFLVLGGTVFLSKAVARLAVRRGHEVTVASRGKTGSAPDGVRFVRIDRSDPDSLASLAGESFDAVVDVSRIPAEVGVALDALADRAGHWTFVSTISVYDVEIPGQTVATGSVHEPTPDDSTDRAVERYGASKVSCENQVRDRLGDRAFVNRPGLIVGPEDPNDRFGYWPRRIAEGGEILAPGSPDDAVQYIDVHDLAIWIVDSAESGRSGTFDAVCPPMPRSRFLDLLAEAFGVDPTFTWVSQDFLLEHEVAPWAGEDSLGLWLPVPAYAGMLDHDVAASVAAGMPVRPLADTARDWHAWYTAQSEPPPMKAGITREREAELLAAWHGRD